MEEVTTITLLDKIRDPKGLVQASKYQYLSDHHMKGKLERLTKDLQALFMEPSNF